jgi:hypothetical protein
LSGRQGREGSEHQGSKNKIGSLKKQWKESSSLTLRKEIERSRLRHNTKQLDGKSWIPPLLIEVKSG